jgi:hypothetical protein
MKFIVDAVINRGISIIRVDHDDETPMIISAGNYSSAAIIPRDTLFKELNEYIATWSEERQDKLWQIYSAIHANLYNSEINTETLTENLNGLVAEIYKLATYENLKTFVYRADLQYPEDLSETYQEFGPRGRNYRERTYIKNEYRELVALALGLRFMIPIWGMYISLIVPRNGNYYKETEAVALLEDAGVKRWPPYVRMEEYVAASVDGEASLSTLMGGLSSEEIPDHLLALALVRKIAVGPLSVTQDKDSLARILFNYVTGTHGRLDTRFTGASGPIVPKRLRGNDEEDNSSVWDMMNQTQEITDGDRMTIEVYTENLDVLIERTCPDLTLSRVQQCISACSRNEARIVAPFQKALIVWVVRTISPEARELLSKKAILRLMGLVQATLDHWGFHELALLVSAERMASEDEESFMPSETRNKITREQMVILNEQYPYYRQETKRLDPTKRRNEVVKAIDDVVDQMSGHQWKPLAPKNIIDKIPLVQAMGFMYISGDIKQQLAAMIIHVNNLIINKGK